jgi:hypothetical protein
MKAEKVNKADVEFPGDGADGDDAELRGYQPPVLTRLGTLAELTRGGTIGPADGLGGAGDDGSL